MELRGKPCVDNNQNNKIRRRIGIQPENDFPEDVNNKYGDNVVKQPIKLFSGGWLQ
jgi:hypothetical protein